jgi:hypothetical protein
VSELKLLAYPFTNVSELTRAEYAEAIQTLYIDLFTSGMKYFFWQALSTKRESF